MTTGTGESGIEWQAGAAGEVPVSRAHADPYFSREDGFGETAHVFLAGNRLPERWAEGPRRFTIGELGFGTGLSFLAAWRLWEAVAPIGAVLEVVSFEAAPLTRGEMARALAPWPELGPQAAALLGAWPEGRAGGALVAADLGSARLAVHLGDARERLPRWEGRAEAWFLDGFAPSRNPEMWEPGLLAALAARTAPGGTFATYTAAGHVRRSLAAAGFAVEKAPGFGRKREMCRGRLAPEAPG